MDPRGATAHKSGLGNHPFPQPLRFSIPSPSESLLSTDVKSLAGARVGWFEF